GVARNGRKITQLEIPADMDGLFPLWDIQPDSCDKVVVITTCVSCAIALMRFCCLWGLNNG
ncbi:hypothetical protein, partial [Salmonella enterica]